MMLKLISWFENKYELANNLLLPIHYHCHSKKPPAVFLRLAVVFHIFCWTCSTARVAKKLGLLLKIVKYRICIDRNYDQNTHLCTTIKEIPYQFEASLGLLNIHLKVSTWRLKLKTFRFERFFTYQKSADCEKYSFGHSLK